MVKIDRYGRSVGRVTVDGKDVLESLDPEEKGVSIVYTLGGPLTCPRYYSRSAHAPQRGPFSRLSWLTGC